MIGGFHQFGTFDSINMKRRYFTAQALFCAMVLLCGGCQSPRPNSSSQALDSTRSGSSLRDERFVGSWKFTNEKELGTPEDVEESERANLLREISADGSWHLANTRKRVSGTWKSVESNRGTWIEFRTTSRIGRRDERLLLSRDGDRLAGFLPDPSDGSLTGYRQVYTRLPSR